MSIAFKVKLRTFDATVKAFAVPKIIFVSVRSCGSSCQGYLMPIENTDRIIRTLSRVIQNYTSVIYDHFT